MLPALTSLTEIREKYWLAEEDWTAAQYFPVPLFQGAPN